MSETKNSRMNMDFTGGKVSGIILYDPTSADITDCRYRPDGGEPFVSVEARDDTVRLAAYLPPDIARMLHHKLGKLFPGDDVVGAFMGLFGMDLTVDNLHELRAKIAESSPQVDFPADVDPVAAIERGAGQ